MKTGAENRKKTILAGSLMALAVCAVGYQLWNLFGGSTPTPPPSIAPAKAPSAFAPARPPVDSVPSGPVAASNNSTGPAVAGVDANKLSTAASSIDPTLDEAAMLRTESLVYGGNGRNVFSATFTPVVVMPKDVPAARPKKNQPPPPPAHIEPPPSCPPACLPIPVKFFGTEKTSDGKLHGFFQNSDNIYLAVEGEIIARRYKITSITANSARVQDLTNGFEQSIPMQN